MPHSRDVSQERIIQEGEQMKRALSLQEVRHRDYQRFIQCSEENGMLVQAEMREKERKRLAEAAKRREEIRKQNEDARARKAKAVSSCSCPSILWALHVSSLFPKRHCFLAIFVQKEEEAALDHSLLEYQAAKAAEERYGCEQSSGLFICPIHCR
jgi:hypothetical protein